MYCVWCCRRVESRRSSDARSPVEHRLMCMWHIGLHYLLPLSQMTAEDNHRDVLSPDVAGISSFAISLVVITVVFRSSFWVLIILWLTSVTKDFNNILGHAQILCQNG